MRRLKTLAGLGCSTLLIAGMVSVTGHGIATAVASSRIDAKTAKQAASEAATAALALSDKMWAQAVRHGELAVSLNPTDAGYRETLGTAYLRAGRFASAEQTFADVLSLQPDNGRAALNLTLAQIAQGKWDQARGVLDIHQARIAPADRGLALALAGDPTQAVAILTAATRAPGANAKTRQNLALAMALAGQWRDARVLAGFDLAPADADARIAQWAVFAKPTGAADQVASLLGVTPVRDPGQPVAIALNASVPVSEPATEAIDPSMPGQPTMGAAAPVPVTAPVERAGSMPPPSPAYRDVAVAVTTAPAPAPMPVTITSFFAPIVRPPAVSATPARVAPPVRTIASLGVYKMAVKAPAPQVAPARAFRSTPASVAPTTGKGDWFVQLGAYDNAAVARDGWSRATRRYPTLASYAPAGMNASVGGSAYYRLSVGGFARNEAAALCRSYRAHGGRCFVRSDPGYQVAAWHQPAKAKRVELAAR